MPAKSFKEKYSMNYWYTILECPGPGKFKNVKTKIREPRPPK